jgi:hypothetical protein
MTSARGHIILSWARRVARALPWPLASSIDGSACFRAGGGRAGARRTDLTPTDLEKVAYPPVTEGFDGADGHGERPALVAPSATLP